MAYTLFPYSQTNSGAVTDAQHALLWALITDGIPPTQTSTALQVSINGANAVWSVQPGSCFMDGKVFSSDAVVTGTLATTSGSARVDAVVCRIDYTTSPWTRIITVRQGTAGSGAPTLSRDRAGVYEFALGYVQRNTDGSASFVSDCRVWHAGSLMRSTTGVRPLNPAAGAQDYDVDRDRMLWWNGTKWQVSAQDTGYLTVTIVTGGNWSETANIRSRLRNGWVHVRGAVQRTNSALQTTASSITDGSGSPVLSALDASMWPPVDVYSAPYFTGGQAGKLKLQASDGRLYISQLHDDIPVSTGMWFDFSFPT